MKILISIFCGSERHAWLNPELVKWMMAISESQPKAQLGFRLEQDLWPLSHARNVAAHRALQAGMDWSVQIDNDEVPPGDFLSCLMGADARNLDVLSIATPTFVGEGRLPVLNVPAHDEKGLENGDLYEEVPRTGGGCFCIHRRVFDKIQAPWFTFEYDAKSGMVESEDFVFCRKVRAAGFRIWIAKGIACEHYKTTGMLHFLRNMKELSPEEHASLQHDVRDMQAPWGNCA